MYFSETEIHNIENAFSEYTQRDDIAILLINQHVCLST
jgi:vacuolar-type H+-ATPase subunit F/Vma7